MNGPSSERTADADTVREYLRRWDCPYRDAVDPVMHSGCEFCADKEDVLAALDRLVALVAQHRPPDEETDMDLRERVGEELFALAHMSYSDDRADLGKEDIQVIGQLLADVWHEYLGLVAQHRYTQEALAATVKAYDLIMEAERDDAKMGYPLAGDSCLAAAFGLHADEVFEKARAVLASVRESKGETKGSLR